MTVSVKIRRKKNNNDEEQKHSQNEIETETKIVHKCGIKILKFDFGSPLGSMHIINGIFRQFLLD